MPPSNHSFSALVLDKLDSGVSAQIRSLAQADLPAGDVLVEVAYSSVNYKDALAVTNRGRIVTDYPIVPGIDLAGTVLESESPVARPGDQVVVCGRGIGEEHWGGYSRLARVAGEWLIGLPSGLDLRRAMCAGTAGYTAMLAAMILEAQGLVPGDGDVLVTGASGGVGSFAVGLLSRIGHRVVALTGRPEHADYLRGLGASEVLDRNALAHAPSRPMLSTRWAGAVDAVGGDVLANVVASLRRHATVAACGVAGGHQVSTTVYPFILRGVNVMGVDSNYATRDKRQQAFDRLAELPSDVFERIEAEEVGLEGITDACERLLDGRIRGRIIVSLT